MPLYDARVMDALARLHFVVYAKLNYNGAFY